jgi:hypothetical protein
MPMRLGQWPGTTRICHLPSAIPDCGSRAPSPSNGVRRNRAHAIPMASRVLSPAPSRASSFPSPELPGGPPCPSDSARGRAPHELAICHLPSLVAVQERQARQMG